MEGTSCQKGEYEIIKKEGKSHTKKGVGELLARTNTRSYLKRGGRVKSRPLFDSKKPLGRRLMVCQI